MPDKTLNLQQIEAITYGEGPLLIIAGAGTGKTTVVTERVKHLITQNLAYRPLGNPNKFIGGLLQHMSRLKDEDMSAEEYIKWSKEASFEQDLEGDKFRELARIYKVYEDIKTKAGVMDFSDLICVTLKLFRTRPNVLESYKNRFKYILVDEFQDTNYAQNQGKFTNWRKTKFNCGSR
jgi:DNA helicase-2/ATP-dependent DNA helicase PcrA